VRFYAYNPPPPLSERVDFFWLIDGGQVPRKERILPSGTTELVMNLHDDEVRIHDSMQLEKYTRLSGAVVSGPYSRVFVCDAIQHRSMLGVHFRPGGAFAFLGAAANDLADTHVNLEDLWGRFARDLREQVCAAKTPWRRFQIVERALIARLGRSPKHHIGVQIALQLFGPAGTGASVRDVARDIGLSQRRLIQVFTTEVGLTPKLLCRLLRFQGVRTQVETMGGQRFVNAERNASRWAIDWAALACGSGYYDQSHLINDFQEFSGLSPIEYLHRCQHAPLRKDNHVPLRT
jgi:AraC-like DNA-binding protein